MTIVTADGSDEDGEGRGEDGNNAEQMRPEMKEGEMREIKKRRKNEKQGRIHGTRCAQYASENNAGRTYGRTYGPTDGRTDTPSYRDATAHLKTEERGWSR